MRFWLVALAAVSLQAQNFDEITIERITTGYSYTEAPGWSQQGFFLWADVPTNRLLQWTPGSQPVAFPTPSNKAQGLVYDAKGNLYLCESEPARLVRINTKGETEVLADKWEGKRLNAPNSVVVRKDGQLYFTDPAFGSASLKRELDFYGVFHIATDDKRPVLQLVARHKARPNGIALSPDGKLLYVAVADEKVIYAYDLDSKGAATNGRVAIPNVAGIPGGLATDEKGNLYVAAKGLHIYTAGGKFIRTIDFTEPVSDLAFGGPEGNQLLITAGPSVYLAKMPVKGSVQY
jgi:gluconolactonase